MFWSITSMSEQNGLLFSDNFWNLTILGSDNRLAPGRRQAIIWTNDGILLIWPLGTNFNEILIEIHTFSFKKIHLKMSSGKWRPFLYRPQCGKGPVGNKSTLVGVIAWCDWQQAITWANGHHDPWHHMASLGHKELIGIICWNILSYSLIYMWQKSDTFEILV